MYFFLFISIARVRYQRYWSEASRGIEGWRFYNNPGISQFNFLLFVGISFRTVILSSCLYFLIHQALCNPQTVNCRDLAGRLSTPLHFASGYNRIDIVEHLLKSGANVHAKDKGYWWAFCVFISNYLDILIMFKMNITTNDINYFYNLFINSQILKSVCV